MDKVNKDLMDSLGRSPTPPSTSRKASCQSHRPGRRLLPPDSCNQGAKTYSTIRQKAYYSGVPIPEASSISEDACAAPRIYHSLLNQADLEQHTPKVTTFKMPENIVSLLDAQVMGPTTERLSKSHFPEQSFKPKVQIAFQTPPGQCPRSIEAERRRWLYLSLDIAQLLASEGIDSNQLIPRLYDPNSTPAIEGEKCPIHLPLKIFDNEDYDCRTPEEWISLGLEPGSHDRKPVPGRALLPTDDALGHEDPKSQKLIYKWTDVGVLDYNKEMNLYLVHKLDENGLVCDEEGRPILNGGITPEGIARRTPLLLCQYWVPRIYLLFLAEDPRVFAQRVVYANTLRKKTEAQLLYNLYVDSMPTDGLNSISDTDLEKIKLWALHTPKLRKTNRVLGCMSCLEKEVKLDYERAMNRMIFDKVVASKPRIFSFVPPPDKEEEKVPEKGFICIPDYPFGERRAAFNSVSLLTKPEVILVLTQVQDECNKVASMSLFKSSLVKHVSLEEFEEIQTQTFTRVQAFLKDTWINTLKAAVQISLRDAGKGWYNLEQSSWDVYQMSKLHKLMKRIRFVQQGSVRCLVQNSLIRFVQLLLDACHGVLNCSEDMEWGDDLIHSPYRPRRNPIFVIDLVLDGSGVHFTPSKESFKESLLSLLDKGILVTHSIPQLEKYVLENIPITGTPFLDSVDLHEPEVEETRVALQSAIQKALIPLQAYAKKYEKFLELNNSGIRHFLKDYQEQCPPAQEVKAIVNTYLSENENLDSCLPTSVIIGPFSVRVEGVKQNLSRKYKALATSLLDLLAENLHSKVENICEAYKVVSLRMHEQPNNIEELTELREWMKAVPEQLAVQEKLICEVMEDYKVMEEFLYNLTDKDFNDKWAASYWPQKIAMQTEAIQLQHLEDEDRFRKIQVMDHSAFEEKLEDMKLIIGEFSVWVDVGQAHTLANEARLVRKQLEELQNLAILYNNREKIFGMKVTKYKKLPKMVKDFQPYCDLWTTVSDWLYWCKSWMDDPLIKIEAEQLEKNVTDSFKTMQKCVKQFKNSPACQGVAMEFQDKIEEFRLYIPLIQGLNNPGMRRRHWKMLSEDISMDIMLGSNLTLRQCLDMNLLDHIESINKVAEIAGKEYAIENALNKMESEWSSVSFTVSLYKDTDTFILKNTDEVSQLLDDHVVMIQNLSFSPFKKPFEDRMNAWENKLKMTQDVLEKWLNCQCSWLYLEPVFSSEDIRRQLPVESERFQTVDTDWRIIMKNANENPVVMSLCPDPALLENLQNCNKLLELVQKGLSEYLETERCAFPR